MPEDRGRRRPEPMDLGGRFQRALTPSRLLAQGAAAAALARARVLRGHSAEDIAGDPRLVGMAEEIARSLGEMKGAAMKIGQALSFVDVSILPEEYRRALSILQADAPAMPLALVEQVVTEELGAPPGEVFSWFSPMPMAAASIGQVHMAHLGEREVVVKVQYPGVARAVEADLRNAALLSGIARLAQRMLAGLVGDVDVRGVIDEVRDRVGDELDYRIEAANQQEFADRWRADPIIGVPDVVLDHSTRRVLTSDYVDGMRWGAALHQSQELRDAWGYAIARFVWTSLLRHGVVNSDVHPGNYIFHEDGRVTFLDFGCVSRLSESFLVAYRRLVAAYLDDDDDRILDALVEVGLLKRRDGFAPDVLLVPIRRALRPFHGDQPHRYSREQLAELIAESMKLRVGADELRLLQRLDVPREYTMVGRAAAGLEALLAHLESAVDHHRLFGDLDDILGLGTAC